MTMASRISLTRDQLATFLKNHEQIKQFERLFEVTEEVAENPDTTGTLIQATNAYASAQSALAIIDQLTQDTEVRIAAAEAKAMQALAEIQRLDDETKMAAMLPSVPAYNSITTDYIDLPETAPHVQQKGRIEWNSGDGTVDFGLYNGALLKVGQSTMYYAKNTSGGTITKGTPVMITGTVGASGQLTFAKAVADGSILSRYMMGVTLTDVANNGFTYVVNFGPVRGFDTSGTPYGEVWADGDLLYFGATTPGTWTKVQPAAPKINAPVAIVVNASSGGSGSIFVRMSFIDKLTSLQDVYMNGGPSNYDLLVYKSATSRWENEPASTVQVLSWMGL